MFNKLKLTTIYDFINEINTLEFDKRTMLKRQIGITLKTVQAILT